MKKGMCVNYADKNLFLAAWFSRLGLRKTSCYIIFEKEVLHSQSALPARPQRNHRLIMFSDPYSLGTKPDGFWWKPVFDAREEEPVWISSFGIAGISDVCREYKPRKHTTTCVLPTPSIHQKWGLVAVLHVTWCHWLLNPFALVYSRCIQCNTSSKASAFFENIGLKQLKLGYCWSVWPYIEDPTGLHQCPLKVLTCGWVGPGWWLGLYSWVCGKALCVTVIRLPLSVLIWVYFYLMKFLICHVLDSNNMGTEDLLSMWTVLWLLELCLWTCRYWGHTSTRSPIPLL